MNLLTALKAAFDSLVRTYSPMLVGLIVGTLASFLGIPVPEEVKEFVVLLVAFLFGAVWYAVLRVIEITRGKASKLLGLGLVKSEPVYDLKNVTLDTGNHTWMTRDEYRAYLKKVDDEEPLADDLTRA